MKVITFGRLVSPIFFHKILNPIISYFQRMSNSQDFDPEASYFVSCDFVRGMPYIYFSIYQMT